MSEKWNEYYTSDEIKKIQHIELESLKVFEEVCQKLNVQFFLYGGTLLGAIKYQGFVPWDDDFDVALMREDYNKLIRYGNDLLPKGYEIQHPTINKVTPYPYIKFRNINTKMVEYETHKLPMNHGVYFDIYPIDNIPDDEALVQMQNKKVASAVGLFILRQNNSTRRQIKNIRDLLIVAIKFLRYRFLRCFPHAWYVKRIDRAMTRYNGVETKRQGNYFYPKPVNFFEGIYPLINVEFEGRIMKIPQGYDINLRNRYGDYSQLPPEDERVGHRPYILELTGE